MLGRVEFPPESFAEVFRLAADAFQIIEILGRYLLEDCTDMRHGNGREAVLFAGDVQVALEETHDLAALGEALLAFRRSRNFFLKFGEEVADGLHAGIVPSRYAAW